MDPSDPLSLNVQLIEQNSDFLGKREQMRKRRLEKDDDEASIGKRQAPPNGEDVPPDHQGQALINGGSRRDPSC